ncbi:unnamed protein product [Caenorhabditis auriculariae]|uniref:C2H2-type domain-containing protein n=1 Tax=Caenorhabditis auriculariae TaxID=2777116 RepID=A0A8S1HMQ8_9PELO|nr:unnamed protein product [Caenorhabditis auriculariae]
MSHGSFYSLGPEDAGRTMSPCQTGPSYEYPTNTEFVRSYQERYVVGNAFNFSKPTGSFSTNAAGQGVVKSTPRKLISNNFDIDFLMANHSVEEQAQERVPETSTPQVVKMKDGVAVLAQPRKQKKPAGMFRALDQASSSGASSSRQPQSVASPDDMPGGSGTFFDPVHQPRAVPLAALDQASSSGASSSRQPQSVASPDDMPGGSGTFFDPVHQPRAVPLAALDQASSSGASSSRQPQSVASPDDMPGGSGTFFDPVHQVEKFACLICQKPYVDPTRIDQHSEKAHGVTDLSSLLRAFYNNQEMINRISVAVTQQVATAGIGNVMHVNCPTRGEAHFVLAPLQIHMMQKHSHKNGRSRNWKDAASCFALSCFLNVGNYKGAE